MSNSRQPVRILVAACAMLACSTAAKADAADFYSGKTVTMPDPSAALSLGIATVFQDLALCENLDVVANIFLGKEPSRFGP